MKLNLADAEKDERERLKLLTDVWKSTQKALAESGWWSATARDSKKNYSTVRINANHALKGSSGIVWRVPMAVISGKSWPHDDTPYAMIFGVSITTSTELLTATLNNVYAFCQDLDFISGLIYIVIGGKEEDNIQSGGVEQRKQNQRLVKGYERMFASLWHSAGIKVRIVEWNKKNATDLVHQLLYFIKEENGEQNGGTKSIKDTLNAIAEKYPADFARRASIPDTKCPELIRQIKQHDPDSRIGQIICKAIVSEVGRGMNDIIVTSYLYRVSDTTLEEKLRMFLSLHK